MTANSDMLEEDVNDAVKYIPTATLQSLPITYYGTSIPHSCFKVNSKNAKSKQELSIHFGKCHYSLSH